MAAMAVVVAMVVVVVTPSTMAAVGGGIVGAAVNARRIVFGPCFAGRCGGYYPAAMPWRRRGRLLGTETHTLIKRTSRTKGKGGEDGKDEEEDGEDGKEGEEGEGGVLLRWFLVWMCVTSP